MADNATNGDSQLDQYAPHPAALTIPFAQGVGRSKSKFAPLYAGSDDIGVPHGGIGTGGIVRSWRGQFSRWTLKTGSVALFDISPFRLGVHSNDRDVVWSTLQAGTPGTNGEFAGLYPKAWHRFETDGITAQSLGYSPVIPGDLELSTLPVALFCWRLTNNRATPADVSIEMALPNMVGWFASFDDVPPRRMPAGCFNTRFDGTGCTGVVFDRRRTGDIPSEGTGQFAIGLQHSAGVEISRTIARPEMSPATEDHSARASWVTEAGFPETQPTTPVGALAGKCRLEPGESLEMTFSLAWDLPTVTFGSGRSWERAHTEFYGSSGTSAVAILERALAEHQDWSDAIDAWHGEVSEAVGDQPHELTAVMNELYFLTDGMSVVTAPDGGGRRHFGLIESVDYPLYNTLDLWIYAAEAVGRHWPELAAAVAADFCDLLLADDPGLRRERWHGGTFAINPIGVVPHDVGGPLEDPFIDPNSYTHRDPTVWRDLNSDLVLCVYREGLRMGRSWRADRFAAVRAALEHLEAFDTDGDGLIENSGTPDQTFDNIAMLGPSSYCSGLWLAALLAGAELADEVGDYSAARHWRSTAVRGKATFDEALWLGDRFAVDRDGPLRQAVFIEQLFGPFLARRLGLGDIVDPTKAATALGTIFEQNYVTAGQRQGAVTLAGVTAEMYDALAYRADRTFQTSEIQPGFNASLAAQLTSWGLATQAEELNKALWGQLRQRGLTFQTPAAFDVDTDSRRALMNMRPLAAWLRLSPPGKETD